MSNMIPINKISSKYFSFNSLISATTDISIIQHEASGFNLFSQIYNDACDCGFIMKSEKTGNEVLFVFINNFKHNDEIGGWIFKAYAKYNKSIKNDIELTIFND